MEKVIYLIRHSAPFVNFENYEDYKSISWSEYNKNMILSVIEEENAKKLCDLNELNNIDEIYASNSFRAIGTAKYIAEQNNLKIKLDDRINEREFGINYLNELPDNFTKLSFDDKTFKVNNGETLIDVDKRFKLFINDILQRDNQKTVIVLHGIILLSYFETICDKFDYDGKNFNILFKNQVVMNGVPKNPDVYKLTFDENKNILDIENIIL